MTERTDVVRTHAYTIGDVVMLDTGPHTLTSQTGGVVRLHDAVTNEHLAMSLTELRRRLVDPEPRLAGLVKYATQPADRRAAADWWAAHLREINDGTPVDPGATPRPEYAPDKPMNQKIALKALEMSRAGYEMSTRKVWRDLKKFRDGGAAELIRQNSRSESPLDRAGKDYVEALYALVAAQTKASTAPKSALYKKLKFQLITEGHGDQMPSLASFYRHLDHITKGKHTAGKATSRRVAANRPDHAFRTERKLRPGEEVQTDSTDLDILVLDHNGNQFRPVLTILVDVRTRCVLSFTLRADGAKAVDHTTLLARAIVPRKLRPGHEEAWAHAQRRLPWFNTLSEEERTELDTSRPYIVPERIMMDNGKDFRGQTFESACRRLGITTTYASGRTPTDKPHVERLLETLKDRFLTLLPGYTGGSVENRGENVEDHALLPVDVFYELLDDAIHRIYHRTPHTSLGNPYVPGARLTPLEAYEASFDLCGSVVVPFTANTYIAMMATEYGTIHPSGIKFAKRYYDSPELGPYRGKRAPGDSQSFRWPFQYDPYDPRAIWVEDPATGEYIECVARGHTRTATPFAFDITEQELLARTARDLELDSHLERELHRLLQRAQNAAIKKEARVEIQRRMVEAEDLPHPMRDFVVTDDEPEQTTDEPAFEYDDFNPYGES